MTLRDRLAVELAALNDLIERIDEETSALRARLDELALWRAEHAGARSAIEKTLEWTLPEPERPAAIPLPPSEDVPKIEAPAIDDDPERM